MALASTRDRCVSVRLKSPHPTIVIPAKAGIHVALALFALATLASTALASEVFTVRDNTIDHVQTCKPLGEILGESMICSKTRSMNNARKQAEAAGASDIVFTNVRCAFGAGSRASARIFDCAANAPVDINIVYEDYLASDSRLAAKTAVADSQRLFTTDHPDDDARDLEGRAYLLVGYAGVTGSTGTLSKDVILAKAKNVGAEVVLLSAKAAGEHVEYQSVTRYSGGGAAIGFATANAYGGGTSISGTGTSVTAIPGQTTTEMVPYAQRTYDTQVLFFRKRKQGPLGLYLEIIPPALRAKLGRNTGAFVVAVEEESPAFYANVLPGDVVTEEDGRPVVAPSDVVNGGAQIQVIRGGTPEPLVLKVSANGS